MRIASVKDTAAVAEIYQQATLHANNVGHIDWPNPFPIKLVDELITTNELYCFDTTNREVGGVAKISTRPDVRIWGAHNKSALYLSKVATGEAVRGADFFTKNILPAICQAFPATERVRLDCLTDNERLQDFYRRTGFVAVGDASFYSLKSKRTISVTRFEMLVRTS